MYLKGLMQGEKFAFYSIVKKLVSIDGDYAAEEETLVKDFLTEMNLEEDQIRDIKCTL